ncbi:MAG: hypothetical protein Q9163_001778 [Psora crenata]
MATTPRMAPTVAQLQKIIRYRFTNASLLWEAMQAPGSIVRAGEITSAAVGDGGAPLERHSVGFHRVPDGNKRLAVVGDVALKMALVEEWYVGGGTRERASRIVSDIGSNASLVQVGRRHGLERFINKHPAQQGAVEPITMAGTVEAIFGAVYLDSGMSSVTHVMRTLGLMPRLVRKIVRDGAADPFVKKKGGERSGHDDDNVVVVVAAAADTVVATAGVS